MHLAGQKYTFLSPMLLLDASDEIHFIVANNGVAGSEVSNISSGDVDSFDKKTRSRL